MSKNLRGLSLRKAPEMELFKEIVNAVSTRPDDSERLLKEISEKYLVGRSSVLGTSSFYDFLRSEHTSKKVFICDGTACLTSGKQANLKSSLLESFSEDEIGTVSCLGHCHTNNALMFDNSIFITEGSRSISEILKSGKQNKPSFNTGTNATFPVLIDYLKNLEDNYRILKKCASDISNALKELELSGLRGRGGAGFPVHTKLKTVIDTESSRKFVICNADEGDPGAFSDKWLLEERPHLVLSGMAIAGMTTGATTGIIYVRREYPESAEAIRKAVAELEEYLLPGFEINGEKFTFGFQVVEGAGAYICGEETSLINSLEGLRPEVRTRPPFPAVYGLFGKPTVLCNVETFANIPYIIKEGGLAYASMGTHKSHGTKLVSLDGGFNRPGVYEVLMGTPLKVVFEDMGGGTRYPVKAYQIGGPLGGIVPSHKVQDIKLDYESFQEEGFLLGHAGVVCIPDYFPLIEFLGHLFEFVKKESCGKCFPCRIGSDRGSELIRRTAGNKEKIDLELFTDLLETMQLGSLCALGAGLSLPVYNLMDYFGEELDEYFILQKL